jgi:Zn-dependent M28 family amino/carboxypeptidase
VNAHYDSVSTGFGSTDDGVGVISILQLLKYFTTKGNQPRHGLVLLLNNGEEDFLNGATVFSQHPMSKLVSTFLNLEGAGAGGRAALFRSTDEAVTKAYAKSPYPFGSATSADGFNRGLIRSQTDYVIFNGKLGLRGLDVAFIGPYRRGRFPTHG